MNRAFGAWLALGATALFLSCRPAKKTGENMSAAPAEKSRAALRLPLDSYLSGAGLRWLVVIRPPLLFKQKVANSSLGRLLELKTFVPSHLLEKVQVAEIEELWVGGYGRGSLYVLDGRRAGRVIEQNFLDEMTSLGEARNPLEGLQIVAGANPHSGYALLHLDGHMVAVAEGDPKLIRYAETRALGTAQAGPSALEGTLLGRLRSYFVSDPLRVFVRGPFEDAPGVVTSRFVAGVAGFSFEADLVTTRFVAVGVWPATTDTETLLRAWMSGVLETPEFRALGLNHPVSRDPPHCFLDKSFDVEGGLTACRTALTWRLDDLAEAILRINRAEMDELLD